MIGVAVPQALWGLVLLPVLFLLRRPRASTRLVVSTVHLWPDAPLAVPSARWPRRRRPDLLTVLRAVFLVTAVLAAAAPYLSLSPDEVVIALDASASMAARVPGGTRFSEAVSRVAHLLSAVPNGTRVTLIGKGTGLAVTSSVAAELVRPLLRLQPGAMGIEPGTVIASRSAGGGRVRAHVVTDRPAPPGLSPDVEWITVGQPAANSAITRISTRRIGEGRRLQVLVEAVHHGPDTVERVLELVVDQQVVGSRRLSLAPGQPRVVVFSSDAPADGLLVARFPEPDALPADDVRRTVAPPAQRPRVLMTGPDDPALAAVLTSNPDIDLEVRDSSRPVEKWSRPDVVVCDLPCPEEDAAGGVLLVASSRPGPGTSAPLALVERAHPVVRGVLGEVTVIAPAALPSGGQGRALLRAGEVAVLLADERPGQRRLELRLSPTASGLLWAPVYPVLMADAIDWLAWRDRDDREAEAGAPLAWEIPLSRSLRSVSVRGPSGQALSFRAAGRLVTVTDSYAAGVYRLAGEGWTESVVVNVSPGESDLWSAPAPPLWAGRGHHALPPRVFPLSALVSTLALGWLTVEWWYRSRHAAGV